ncbi:hypothetical protein GCM10022234_07450 [Aeromicrobium panaciterrae]|uniref:hypothetical protein n=1 Tax=Aeromicrobium panaciterrae TaxID=363861 RepID=UPI0031D87314
MTDTSIAEKLRITEGYVVWVIGQSVEETALLDPLPEGAVAIERRTSDDEDDEPDLIDGAVLFVESRAQLEDDLDEFLPQLGSIPVVWICFPVAGRTEIAAETIGQLVADYGWHTVENVPLDDAWSGVRLEQA